jgi:hypothetical protein
MLERQHDQAERVETLRNDLRVRQGSTFFAHAQADAQLPGRFSSVANAFIVGSTPDVAASYPAASAAHQTELPPEEPLGFEINAMPEPGPLSLLAPPVAQAPDPASADAPLIPLSDGPRADVGSLSQTDDPATGGPARPSASPRALRGGAGSSGFRRRI